MKRLIGTATALLLVAVTAQAHTHLEASSPADKSTVAAPAALEMHFNEATRITALTLQKGTQAATRVDGLPAQPAKEIRVPVSGLAAGTYTVNWRAIGDDGHVVSGSFGFTVDPAAPMAKLGGAHGHDH